MFRRIIGGILIISGIVLFMYPYAAEAVFDYQTQMYVKEFKAAYGTLSGDELSEDVGDAAMTSEAVFGEAVVISEAALPEDGTEATEDTDVIRQDSDLLYEQCVAYNLKIYEENQAGFCDAWSYEQPAVEVDAESFGYIEIPAMDLIMPLYLGASEDNMAKGAAVLGETSVPIGGENTNSVIAGHRGYRGIPYFREIEKLSVGDEVYVTNPWETLTYRVTEIDIISPNDAEAVKIREGKDMITLITCHPYRSHGKKRYVVYCERVDAADAEPMSQTVSDTQMESDYLVGSDGTAYTLSSGDIQRERIFRLVCAGILLIILLSCIIKSREKST